MITRHFAGARALSLCGMGSVGSYTKFVLALEPNVAYIAMHDDVWYGRRRY